MNKSVAIYEPLYAQDQALADPEFIPLVRAENARAEWREFGILVDMYRNKVHLRHDFTGLFSPKFNLKAKISGARFLEFVRTQANADVCFINPFPQIAYWSYNVWMQGEHAHPGLTRAAQELIDACKLGWKLGETPRHDCRYLAYSNFWVGSQQFWERYVGGVLVPIAEFLESEPTHVAARNVMEETSHTDPAPFLPFIVERLFSTFVSTHADTNTVAYPLTHEQIKGYCNNDFERLLLDRMRTRIDAADSSHAFGSDLIEQMDTVCALWQQHFFDYYALRPHPHTMNVVTRG